MCVCVCVYREPAKVAVHVLYSEGGGASKVGGLAVSWLVLFDDMRLHVSTSALYLAEYPGERRRGREGGRERGREREKEEREGERKREREDSTEREKGRERERGYRIAHLALCCRTSFTCHATWK